MADSDFERFGNMLAKQFMEKEQRLKLLLKKYSDQRLAETENLKACLMAEYMALDHLPDEDQKREATHKLQVREANLLRELQLSLDKAHKEEET